MPALTVVFSRALRWMALCCLSVSAVVASGCQAPRAEAPHPPSSPFAAEHQQAETVFQTWMHTFWDGPGRYMLRHVPRDGIPASYWIYVQAIDAALDGAERTSGMHYKGLVRALIQGQGDRNWNSSLYDDENWFVLVLLRAYDLTQDSFYLERARNLYAHIQAAWDTTCCGDQPGGIWWDNEFTLKATASNAGPVVSAVRLFERTGELSYLDFAKEVYAHWWKAMVNPETGEVTDSIGLTGVKGTWLRFTYNEGQVLAAATELHRFTGDSKYLEDAHRVAGFMLRSETKTADAGPILWDGDEAACVGDCHQFKGIAYRFLKLLHQTDARPEYEEVLRASARTVWEQSRDLQTGLSSPHWMGPPTKPYVSLAQQNTAVMVLNQYALLRGQNPGVPRAGRWEAEDAHYLGLSLGLRRDQASGWGYVTGFGQTGQSIQFEIAVPSSEMYALRLRYAAGRRGAARAIAVDGQVVGSITFPATDNLDAFNTVSFPLTLDQGRHSLAIQYQDTHSHFGGLSLDFVQLDADGTCDEPRNSFELISPGPGAPFCVNETSAFCWTAVEDAQRYELVIDGQVQCTTQDTCCRPKAEWKSGRRRWYVRARLPCGSVSSSESEFITALPHSTAPNIELDGSPLTRVRFSAVPEADHYDVFIDDQRVCAGLKVTSCQLTTPLEGIHQIRVEASNVCQAGSATVP